jgi:hypothetical protein
MRMSATTVIRLYRISGRDTFRLCWSQFSSFPLPPPQIFLRARIDIATGYNLVSSSCLASTLDGAAGDCEVGGNRCSDSIEPSSLRLSCSLVCWGSYDGEVGVALGGASESTKPGGGLTLQSDSL